LENEAYAFASDYMRLKVLYDHGGIYMDTDVEVLKDFEPFLDEQAFLGLEAPPVRLGSCVLGAKKKSTFIGNWLSFYDYAHFKDENGKLNLKPNTHTITEIAKLRYPYLHLDNKRIEYMPDVTVYPVDYFCPLNRKTQEMNVTQDTHAIHRFNNSWIHLREQAQKEN
jgi:mannosyltransferase OCH1-like enzyme